MAFKLSREERDQVSAMYKAARQPLIPAAYVENVLDCLRRQSSKRDLEAFIDSCPDGVSESDLQLFLETCRESVLRPSDFRPFEANR